jgi:hypothetical protein
MQEELLLIIENTDGSYQPLCFVYANEKIDKIKQLKDSNSANSRSIFTFWRCGIKGYEKYESYNINGELVSIDNSDKYKRQIPLFKKHAYPPVWGDVLAFAADTSEPVYDYRIRVDGVNHKIKFQSGDASNVGLNGVTENSLLAILIDRLRSLQAISPCRENAIALTKMEEANHWLRDKHEAGQEKKD